MSSSQHGLTRRQWLQLASVGALSVPVSGWFDVLASRAAQQAQQAQGRPRHKSCILLFMEGGPSHIDTFDPRPENTTSEIRPIATRVPGIQIGQHLPRLAESMQHMALLRGMSTSEGSHGRARYYMHTGYRQGVGGVIHPSLGAIASNFLGSREADLPNFVSIGDRSFGAGYAGPMHAPVEIADPNLGIENLRTPNATASFDRQLGLLEQMEEGFLDRVQTPSVQAHQATYQRAAQLMRSPRARAFDLSQERSSLRDAYGRNRFGQGCLLARRLVEHGVAFVEVQLGGWDTHINNPARVQGLCQTVDPAFSTLITDLRDRGLFDSTLVIWMGEFGRTPHVGRRGGRDHWPRAWTSVLAGAGLRLGQAIGRTDRQGGTVEAGRVNGVDFMATVCRALGIDYNRNFRTPTGRPMRVVDRDEHVVGDLF
jgi:hypothetical protein